MRIIRNWAVIAGVVAASCLLAHPALAQPVNDTCAAALTVGENSSTPWTTLAATDTPGLACRGGSDVWFEVTPSVSGTLVVALGGVTNAGVGTGTDTNHSLYLNPGAGLCPVDADQVACIDPFVGSAAVTAGQSYLVRIGHWSTTSVNQYNGTLNLLMANASNDGCADAITVAENSSVAWSTLGATDSVGLASCGGSSDVWFEVTPSASGLLVVALSGVVTAGVGTGTNTIHSVYLNPGGGFCPTDGDQVLCSDPLSASFNAVGGQSYLIRIGSVTAAPTQFHGVLAVTLYQTPANDDCASAISIGEMSTTPWATVAASDTPGLTCAGGSDIWYEVTPTVTGTLFMALSGVTNPGIGTGTNTIHSLYLNPGGGLCPTDGDQVACIDPLTGSALVTAGQSYLLRIGSVTATPTQFAGTLTLNIAPQPANDLCADAISVGENSSTPWTTFGATNTAGLACRGGSDVWFEVTPTASGILGMALTGVVNAGVGSGTDTNHSLYLNPGGGLCPVDADQVACIDPFTGLAAVTAGQSYLVRIGHWSTTTINQYSGTLELALTPTGNDDCASAISVSENSTSTWSTLGATDTVGLAACAGSSDVWFEVTPTITGTLFMTLSGVVNAGVGTGTNTIHSLYLNPGGGLCPTDADQVACIDPLGGSASVTAGQSYLLRIGSVTVAPTQFHGILTLALVLPPANDDCANAIAVSDTSSTPWTTLGAATTPGLACRGSADVWFEVTPTISGELTLALSGVTGAGGGTSTDTNHSLYLNPGGGMCPTDADQLACIDPFTGTGLVVAGQSYLVRIGAWSTTTVAMFNGTLNLSIVPACFIGSLSADFDCDTNIVTLSWLDADAYSSISLTANGMPVLPGPTVAGAGMPNSYQDMSPPSGSVTYELSATCSNMLVATASVTIDTTVVTPGQELIISPLPLDTLSYGDIDDAAVLEAALIANGRTVAVLRQVPLGYACIDDLTAAADNVWVLNGTFPDDHRGTLAEFDFYHDLVVTDEKNLYFSGGDHWGFLHVASLLDQIDGVSSAADGDDSFLNMVLTDTTLGPVPFATDLGPNHAYAHDQTGNDYTDRLTLALAPLDTGLFATEAFVTQTPLNYITGALNETLGGQRTIMTSFEFGGFGTALSREQLAGLYLDFFGAGGPVAPMFVRGNCNGLDTAVNIADAVYLLGFLFPGANPPNVLGCPDACDANDDGALNIADVIRLLGSLFGNPTVPLPVPNTSTGCGVDTGSTLGCGTNPPPC